ncbi:ABC transporter substrate-binding protein [Streptomyces pluripotens]|uniref:ABC transporter substrate-binding protein n=1 Tax=Streptomyces pluripotens TaxID=1355015 RepID=A0A221NUN6_9ACTN|nr:MULTISPECIES: ABC transporter substrate-binding protein [Streptomyces]ARP69421.1 ABC transporter substrate-binding protein [Streptomyces pluripotens]ASN23681.1 ABC transporter substrate-binding protein [Streptomyces pluripotens]KIE28288.1 ABC transporter substrate-binding protein [Streptomyces sp. MUSC 125]MCH0555375.1 ABC transporter substrate-binding protein [Streptomyces sp. MUM 16J]
MNVRNHWPVLPLAVGLASGMLTGCGSESDGSAGTGSSVVMGMSDDVLATDPASGYDPGSWLLFNNVFQSLLAFPKGATEPEPELAKECDFTDTRATVYRCELRDGLKFSNGDSLTSQDVKFSFDRLMKINDPAGPAIMFPMLGRVEAPDAKTVVFHLTAPDATFPSKIASGAGSIVDHRQYDPDRLRTDHKAVGSGPYKLDSFDKGQAVFSVNGNYKGSAEVSNSGVTLKFFHGDRAALKKSLLDGGIDIAYRGLTAKDIAGLDQQDGNKGIDVIEGSSAEIQHLVFNIKDPVAGKLGVRKAMAYLLDRDALIRNVYQGTATPLYSIIPAGITGHNAAFFDTYGARPSRAKAAAALQADGITGKVKLTLWSTPSRYGPATDQELKAIAGQLNASGLFDADVKSVAFDQYEKDIAKGKYGVYVKGWVPDYPDPDNFTAPFFGKGNVLDNNYSNRTITGTLIPGTAAQSNRGATDKEFGELQDIVADELPILPVWQAKQYAVARDGVYGLGYCLDASTVFRFWELRKS